VAPLNEENDFLDFEAMEPLQFENPDSHSNNNNNSVPVESGNEQSAFEFTLKRVEALSSRLPASIQDVEGPAGKILSAFFFFFLLYRFVFFVLGSKFRGDLRSGLSTL
jgi:hypothetical protein